MYNAYADLEGYNCFGCSPTNPYGLKCKFVDEGEYITCHWVPSENYQGFFMFCMEGYRRHWSMRLPVGQSFLMKKQLVWQQKCRWNTDGLSGQIREKFGWEPRWPKWQDGWWPLTWSFSMKKWVGDRGWCGVYDLSGRTGTEKIGLAWSGSFL